MGPQPHSSAEIELFTAEELCSDAGRSAVAVAAASLVHPRMTIGLGSGRAVFLLAILIGDKLGPHHGVRACVASPDTAEYCRKANIEVVEIDSSTRLDVAFDGADEVDPNLNLIKGKGAALVREKLLIATADRCVIMAQADKAVSKLGERELLPVEVIPYAWQQTRNRVADVLDEPALRATKDGDIVVTSNGNYLLDGRLRSSNLAETADRLDRTLGVVDHGLFLHQASEVIFGHPDGTTSIAVRG